MGGVSFAPSTPRSEALTKSAPLRIPFWIQWEVTFLVFPFPDAGPTRLIGVDGMAPWSSIAPTTRALTPTLQQARPSSPGDRSVPDHCDPRPPGLRSSGS